MEITEWWIFTCKPIRLKVNLAEVTFLHLEMVSPHKEEMDRWREHQASLRYSFHFLSSLVTLEALQRRWRNGILEILKSRLKWVSCAVVYHISTGCIESFHSVPSYLIRIVHQWTVITMITNSIPIWICLVCVVDIWAIISFIENICQDKKATPIKQYV